MSFHFHCCCVYSVPRGIPTPTPSLKKGQGLGGGDEGWGKGLGKRPIEMGKWWAGRDTGEVREARSFPKTDSGIKEIAELFFEGEKESEVWSLGERLIVMLICRDFEGGDERLYCVRRHRLGMGGRVDVLCVLHYPLPSPGGSKSVYPILLSAGLERDFGGEVGRDVSGAESLSGKWREEGCNET